jgi:hypothetical protein
MNLIKTINMNKFSVAVILAALFLVSCEDTTTEEYTPEESIKTEHLTFKEIKDVKPILADNESTDVLYKRAFNVRNLLQIAADDNEYIKVTNYSPIAFKNITIYAKLNNYPERIKLVTLDSVASLSEFRYKSPLIGTDKSYYTETGKWVNISGLQSMGGATLSVDSPDPLFVKLKNLKTNWTVHFSIKGNNLDENAPGAGGWWIMNPVHCRENIVLFTNLAYLFSSDEFKQNFLAYEGLINNDGSPIDRAQREKIYNQIINWSNFETGLVKGVNGLGGGNTFGLAEFVLFWQYQDIGDVTFHELGHCLGFGHSSNMTYPSADGKAFFKVCLPIFQTFLKEKKAPFWDYKTLNSLKKYRGTSQLLDTDPNTVINYTEY